MSITERTLRRWRRDALVYGPFPYDKSTVDNLSIENSTFRERILRMTQELLDQHLLRKENK